jgi:hypothetical protein
MLVIDIIKKRAPPAIIRPKSSFDRPPNYFSKSDSLVCLGVNIEFVTLL